MKAAAIERIKFLRAFYKTGPVFSEWVNFNRQRRQRLNYMRALSQNGHLYSYRLRRADAEAFLLDQMEPVINENELLVGLPDLSPLTDEEQKEYDELERGMQFSPQGSGIAAAHMALDYDTWIQRGMPAWGEVREK